MNLWYPESTDEIAFVKNTFSSVSGNHFVGIEQFVSGNLFFFSDNSFNLGVPFVTGQHFEIIIQLINGPKK